MITKEIVAYGKKQIIGCDAKCEKAFGYKGRPFLSLSEDPDDICWLSDNEVGLAPETGKTVIVSEGGDMKPDPDYPETLLNRWCYRECERCACAEMGETLLSKDFSQRQYNQPVKHDMKP